ncbi:uncharacterized protein AMSG_03560 [Thecamonas trahens ATCC 50062]|uniref:RRM domain-containing protein n=1 Tax=Thecamonas trahens ATCC 50062 TaxID=461836 RepID=A0A0L0D4Z6_THETB|nr:hypothetical protein AMSG_03560 [Thecamonas trahens ATCC 50062]KNC47131.1 hypothetical protein AMSG_03560 [Thecamonas trahens ATCC 50062]|eukprot:XP_013759907.1 hypothetical protein AMSG_03560 [Thecamonas trahens ATCC 50062]
MSKIFVFGLPWKTTSRELMRHFQRFGTVLEAHAAVKDKRSQHEPRALGAGYGFVCFTSVEEAEAACALPHELRGRELVVRIADKPVAFTGKHLKPRFSFLKKPL